MNGPLPAYHPSIFRRGGDKNHLPGRFLICSCTGVLLWIYSRFISLLSLSLFPVIACLSIKPTVFLSGKRIIVQNNVFISYKLLWFDMSVERVGKNNYELLRPMDSRSIHPLDQLVLLSKLL